MAEQSAIHILINRNAGTVMKMGEEGITQLLQETGLNTQNLNFCAPEELNKQIEFCAQQEGLVLIGGGDGSIAQALPAFMKENRGFGILPLGTMNMLAQDLKIPTDLKMAAESYARGFKKVKIDVALANDIPFLCCASLGTMPKATEFREENRAQIDLVLLPRLTLFVLSQLNPRKRRHMMMVLDKKTKYLRTPSLVISNNEFAHSDEGLDSLKKETLRDGILGIYVTSPTTLWDRIRLLLKLRIGGWKKDGAVREYKARYVRIFTRKKYELVSVDGENIKLKTPLEFTIRPKALNILVPAAR